MCTSSIAADASADLDSAIEDAQDPDLSDGASDVCDDTCSYGDGSSDVPPPFSLLDLPGLVLWLQPGNFVTDSANRIVRWTDASSFANHADQGSSSNRPLPGFARDGGVDPAASFDITGQWLQIADSDSLTLHTDDFVFAAVVSISSAGPGTLGVIYRKQNSTISPFEGLNIWGSWPAPDLGPPDSFSGGLSNEFILATLNPYSDDSFHAVVFFRRGALIALRIDGDEQLTANDVRILDLSTTEPAFIGAHGDGPGEAPRIQALVGSISEMLIVKGRADVALVTAIEQDLASRHPTLRFPTPAP
jgi:hypothetical protein